MDKEWKDMTEEEKRESNPERLDKEVAKAAETPVTPV